MFDIVAIMEATEALRSSAFPTDMPGFRLRNLCCIGCHTDRFHLTRWQGFSASLRSVSPCNCSISVAVLVATTI